MLRVSFLTSATLSVEYTFEGGFSDKHLHKSKSGTMSFAKQVVKCTMHSFLCVFVHSHHSKKKKKQQEKNKTKKRPLFMKKNFGWEK